jgi:glycosyltransferase 2 family protein
MLVGLWQFDREDVLAGVLLFRLLYYIVPFTLSLLILGSRELLIALRGTPLPPVRTLPSLAPTDIATVEPEREAERRMG